MKGFIKQAGAMAGFGTVLFTLLGCVHYRNLVDPCWPERYSSAARHSVREMSMAQTELGHKLDQTIWSHYFDPGTDRLNKDGRDRLMYISQRQPHPDFQIWLQFPHDAAKDKDGLIAKRKDAIRGFLTTHTVAANGSAYQIGVHDHVVPTYPADWNRDAAERVRDLKGRQWQFEEKDAKSAR